MKFAVPLMNYVKKYKKKLYSNNFNYVYIKNNTIKQYLSTSLYIDKRFF